jgi:hypothetical protein
MAVRIAQNASVVDDRRAQERFGVSEPKRAIAVRCFRFLLGRVIPQETISKSESVVKR